jgi:O-antigen ligase
MSGAPSVALRPAAVRLAVAPLLLAAFTSTWSIVKPVGGLLAISDYLLGLSLLITIPMVVLGNLPFAVPGWIFIPGIVIPACVLVRQIDPPPYFRRVLRLQVQQYHPDSFGRALIWLAALYVVPLAVIAGAAIERRLVEWVMGAYVAGVAISCVVAITDLLGLTHIAHSLSYQLATANPLYYAWGERYAGLSDHPNMLGLVCATSLPFVIYFMSRMRRTWISGIAFIALSAGLLASGSRGAQAVSLLSLLVAVLCLPNKRTTVRALSLSLSITIAVGVVALYTVLAQWRSFLLRFTGTGAERAQTSNEGRIVFIKQAWTDWQTYPLFGAGIRHISDAHNIYLQLLAAGGVVLTVGILVYFFCILRDCWRLSRHGIILARFLMMSIATWLVLGMIENEIVDRELYFTVGCVAALVTTTNLPRHMELVPEKH